MKDSLKKAKVTLRAARSALNIVEQSITDITKAADIIEQRRGDIIVTGIGKSGFIGQKIAATLTSLGHRASFLHPVEAIHGDIGALSAGDVLIAISFSGESKEVAKITSYAKKSFHVPVIGISRGAKTTLGKLADINISLPIKDEGSPKGIAPMASTTATLVVGDILASVLTSEDFRLEKFAKFHPGGALGLRLKTVGEVMTTGNKMPKVKKDDTFFKAVNEINNKKLGVTAVLGIKSELSGVITDGDIRRFLLKSKDFSQAKAKDAMTKSPKVLRHNDSLEKALEIMEKYKITTMFIVGDKKDLVGVVHIHDIIESSVM